MTTSTILYLIGSAMFILIGMLHTFVHFKGLVIKEVEDKISNVGYIKVGGHPASVWKMWQGMSLLFGVFMGILGLNNILAIGGRAYPPLSITLVMMVVLLLVIYSGKKYFTNMQVYGGIVGLLIFGISLYLNLNQVA